MTISELMHQLGKLDPDMKVYSMGPDCGGYDYCIFTGVKFYKSRDGSKVLLGTASDPSWTPSDDDEDDPDDWLGPYDPRLGESNDRT